jgi:AcrR family transcriptional regulator
MALLLFHPLPAPERQHTVAEIAEAVGVHRTTVYDYLRKES